MYTQNINQTIVSLLQLTYTSADTMTVKSATEQLFSYAPFQGFLPALMHISTNPNTDYNLTMAALSQLKNCIRRYWNRKQFYDNIELNERDKEYFRNNIIALNIALSDNDKYGKIVKDVIANIADSLYGNIEQVIGMITNGEELRTCLNFLLGTIDFYRCHDAQEGDQKQKFIEFVNLSVPSLTKLIIFAQNQLNNLYDQTSANPIPQMIQNYKNQSAFMQQIMYLSIKFMSKIIQKDIPYQIREYVFQWAEVCMNRLNDTNEQMHKAVRDDQHAYWPKRSQIFIYFHSRKWAIEYLYRFLYRVMVYKKSQPAISEKTQRFYHDHLNTLTDVIKNLFIQPQTAKIRARQLKLLQKLFTNKPVYMKQFLPYYQFEVLPNYIYFDQEDYNLAKNPIQFIGYEEQAESGAYQSQNLRAITAALWVGLTVDYAQRQLPAQNGEIYNLSLHYIFKLLEQNDKKYQLAGVYLMNKLSKKIKLKQTQITQVLTGLTNYILEHFLICDDFLLQYITLEVFITNNRIIQSPVRKYILNHILTILYNKEQVHIPELIKINAIIALEMFHTEQLAIIEEQRIKDIIQTYLDMIMIYELESITVSFRLFVDRLRERAMPYAVIVIKQLGEIIRSIDIDPYDGGNRRLDSFKYTNKNGVWSAAIETLAVFSLLVTKQTSQLKSAIEQQLDYLLQQYLSVQQEQQTSLYEHTQTILYFLNSYLQTIKKYQLELPSGMKFYQMVVTLKMSGLPPTFLLQDGLMAYSSKKRSIIESCGENWSYTITDYLKTLKLFTGFIRGDLPMRSLGDIRSNLTKSNQLQQFMYMVFSYYQNNGSLIQFFDEMGQYKGKMVATILLIYFIEQNYKEIRGNVYYNIFIVIRMNEKIDRVEDCMKRYNRQLFYLWFWANFANFQLDKNEQNKNKIVRFAIYILQNTTKEIIKSDFLEQMRRIALGHCSLLLASIFTPKLKHYQNKIIDILFAIMKRIFFFTDVLFDQSQPKQRQIRKRQQIYHRQDNQIDDPYINEPNYLIELPRNYEPQDDLYQDQFKREFDPAQIYETDYTTKLGQTIDDQFWPFLQAIKTYQKYDPQGYREKIESTEYGVLLNTVIEIKQREKQVYEVYKHVMREQFDN